MPGINDIASIGVTNVTVTSHTDITVNSRYIYSNALVQFGGKLVVSRTFSVQTASFSSNALVQCNESIWYNVNVNSNGSMVYKSYGDWNISGYLLLLFHDLMQSDLGSVNCLGCTLQANEGSLTFGYTIMQSSASIFESSVNVTVQDTYVSMGILLRQKR